MKRTRHLIPRALSVGIIGVILLQTVSTGQSTGLAIQVLEANEGENLIGKELPPLKVRVMDRTGRVIPGANVQFRAPEDGPSGHFVPNSSQITVTTDTQGMATAPRFLTNSKVGDYQVEIVASYRDSVSRAVIPQTNIFKAKSSNKKFIILSALIGGAAVAAFARGGGNAGPASTALEALAGTPTISFGGSSVGVSSTPLAPIPTVPSGTASSPLSTTSGSAVSMQPTGSIQPPAPAPIQAPAPAPCSSKSKSNKNGC